MELHIFKTPGELVRALADFLVLKINDAIAEHDECTVSLSGGNSPRKLYELLASWEYRNAVAWDKVYFFFGDERYVPFTDPDNNGMMLKQVLFDPLKIAGAHIYYMNTSLPPEISAEKYESAIYSHFGDRPVRFDLMLLGLGDNAHTASLFPNTPVLKEQKKLVSAVQVEDKHSLRITMTAALINESDTIVFLAYGASKANAVYEVLKGKRDATRYPAQLIESETGTVHWFLDTEAAEKIQ